MPAHGFIVRIIIDISDMRGDKCDLLPVQINRDDVDPVLQYFQPDGNPVIRYDGIENRPAADLAGLLKTCLEDHPFFFEGCQI